METVWSLDFCLTCDRQTAGEPYCSQVCRLADLDSLSTPSRSEPASPTHPTTSTSSCVLAATPSPTAGFFLPPAFDFAPFRRPSPAVPSRPSSSCSSRASGVSSPDSSSTASSRLLTPSSYRGATGTGSTGPLAADDSISEQARSELRDYTNSFDTVRHFRRRLTG